MGLYNYLKIWNLRVIPKQQHRNIEEMSKIKFLAMRFTNQKFSFDIFTVGNVQNIFMIHDL